ncbi:ABC transporter permease [Enterovirga sp. CN4-39]|uniref:ABC transporter permease n=1 Tax=Enterovirga sp. CN4-39 TaxID=3400910 RepID=UPI003C051BC5
MLATVLGRAGLARRKASLLLRDPFLAVALVVLGAAVAGAVFADVLAPYSPMQTSLRFRARPPSGQFLLGTDEQGRDILSRILFGMRLTLATGLFGLAIGMTVGSLIGFAAAYFRQVDNFLMRCVDVILSFPAILLGLAIAGATGPGLTGIVIALAVSTIGPAARIARSSALSIVSLDYVTGARMIGLGNIAILARHILPNCLPALVVYGTLRFGQVILLGASLSFLGLGIAPPVAELGVMVSQGRSLLLTAPHVSLIPCGAILLLVLSLNIIGDALRDALDPTMRD